MWQDYKIGVIQRVLQFTIWFDQQKRRDRGGRIFEGGNSQKIRMLFARAVTFVVAVVAVVGADEPIIEKKCDKNILWTGGTFEWPCMATKSIFKNNGRYISKNILATRVAIYKDDAILALPRYEIHNL